MDNLKLIEQDIHTLISEAEYFRDDTESFGYNATYRCYEALIQQYNIILQWLHVNKAAFRDMSVVDIISTVISNLENATSTIASNDIIVNWVILALQDLQTKHDNNFQSMLSTIDAEKIL